MQTTSRTSSDADARTAQRREGLSTLSERTRPPARNRGPVAREAARNGVGIAQRQPRGAARRIGGNCRPQWRRQEHAAEARHRNGEGHRRKHPCRRTDRRDPRARHGLPSRIHRPAERVDVGTAARLVGEGRERRDAGGRGVRRDRHVLRPAAADLLERHAGPAGVQHRHRRAPRRADRRRSAVGRRHLFPAQVHGANESVQGAGDDHAAGVPRSDGRRDRSATARSCSITGG